MAIQVPGAYGLILRKNERTAWFIAREADWFLTNYQGANLNEDEHLIAFKLAQNLGDLVSRCAELVARGARQGVDFVQTDSCHGVRGPLPEWLADVSPTALQQREQAGFSPELWAKFEPDVQKMWTDNLARDSRRYALAQS